MTTRTMDPYRAPQGRTWPVTAGLVALAVLLVAVDLFGAAIATASFFGDAPSRSQYLAAGATALTAVLPLAVLAVAGWSLGSRWGLAVIGLLASLSAVVGVATLGQPGDPIDPDPGRALAAGDFVTDLNVLNGLALVVALLVLALALVVRRRQRAGAAAHGSSSTPAS